MLRCMVFTLCAMATMPVAIAGPRLPVLENHTAWQRLPGAPTEPQALPTWARILAGPMPLTTSRMLELDALHRTGDRLDARLRALARWAAADANQCEYAKAVAAADFARAGGDAARISDWVYHPDTLPALDRAAVGFARRMMREAHAVTDDEVRNLIALAGEERTMALVALVAHASFQDRVLLALGVDDAGRTDPPPLAVRFVRPKGKPPTAKSAAAPSPMASQDEPLPADTAEWLRTRTALAQQQSRPGRVRVPSTADVLTRIGSEHPAAWQTGIIWSRVCYGYQPELTDAWFDCAAAFRQESGLDRVYQNEVFWVVTDAVRCFY